MLQRLLAFAPLLRAGAMRNPAVPRRQLLGGAVAAGATLAPPAIAAPDWLQDVPTESADVTFAATRSERLGQAPSAVMTPSTQRTQSSRETSAVLAAQKAALEGTAAATTTVRLSMRIARPDGTFYVRAKGEEDPEPPKIGDVDVELFGKAPAAVATFLAFALGDPASADAPTYASAILDERGASSDGQQLPVVYAARRLRGVETRSIGGEQILVRSRDGGEVLSRNAEAIAAKLRKEPSAVEHTTAGILTRQRGDAPQAFGLTVAGSKALDATHQAFGRVVRDNSNLISAISTLNAYSLDAAPDGLSKDVPGAAAIYRAQKDAFRGAAKAFGDGRASKIFPGKLLRRVEITRVELL